MKEKMKKMNYRFGKKDKIIDFRRTAALLTWQTKAVIVHAKQKQVSVRTLKKEPNE